MKDPHTKKQQQSSVVSSSDAHAGLTTTTDAVTITDGRVTHGRVTHGRSRRRFMRQSSALLLATGAAIVSAEAYADCDGQAGQYKRCSDSDSGENSDPRGCGRCGRSENVPSSGSHAGPHAGPDTKSGRWHRSVQSDAHDDIMIDSIRLPKPDKPAY